jgi:acyl carrier protein
MNDHKTIEQRLISLFATQLGLEESAVTLDKEIERDLGADSLDLLELIMAVEEEFDVIIDDSKIGSLAKVQDVVTLVRTIQTTQGAVREV